MSLTIGSLFAGIGGFDLGLERAGMKVLWQVEIDEYCQRVLAKHWPDVERFGDIRECGARNLRPVDVLCGGFPCQPVSIAGRQLGQDDSRWLWPEFARIIRELRPRYAIMENVPGLFIRGFGDVLGDLADLGYDVEWQTVSAAAFGAPHLRRRIFVLATPVEVVHPMRARLQGLYDAGRREYLQSVAPNISEYIWHADPEICRKGDGISRRMDRLRGLGNAVVPQIAEWIGRRIITAA